MNLFNNNCLEVNIDNLKYNYEQIKKFVDKDTLISAVIKANAYGLGSVIIAKELIKCGVDRFSVSTLSEGLELRCYGIQEPINILNYTSPKNYLVAIKNDLQLTIYDYNDAKQLSNIAKANRLNATAHIKINTGLNRLGFLCSNNSLNQIIKLSKLPNLYIEGIFTHFSTADSKNKTYTNMQYNLFNNFITNLKEKGVEIDIRHISNSAAIIDFPEYSLDMVRPGIILYGYYPSNEVDKCNLNLKPTIQLKSLVSQIKVVGKNQYIGYGNNYLTKKPSKIATLPIGFADGVPRSLSNKGCVTINNTIAPIVGNICMDQMMIDVSLVENVNIEDTATIFGYEYNNISLEKIARLDNTNIDEIMCCIGRRVPRIYYKNNRISEISDFLLT